ncbi:MAG: hypothetical protein ACOYZ8_15360 [Chloroflexota bacterium]
MRRLFPIIPVFLFVFLSACGDGGTIPTEIVAAVVQSQTATMWTPTSTTTPDPDESKIVQWLNGMFAEADPLEQTVDANYKALDVSFVPGTGGVNSVLRIDVRCECALEYPCCAVSRIFVVTINAMKAQGEKIIGQIPGSVMEVQVSCYDHAEPIGMAVVNWAAVRRYLQGEIIGYQLGSHVRILTVP